MASVQQVVGAWKVIDDPFNPKQQTVYRFHRSGDLTLTFDSPNRTQYIFLKFTLDGDTIIMTNRRCRRSRGRTLP
jgi:hypothetical protein